MSTHTRGPWVANNCTVLDALRHPIAYTGAMADQSLKHLDVCQANARLIAAAPEMLAELKRLSAVIKERTRPGSFTDKIDAVIARAETPETKVESER
jgi:hypothetical protein